MEYHVVELEFVEAFEYVQDTLQHGKTIAKSVAKSGKLSGGRVFTYVPRKMPRANLRHFDRGHHADFAQPLGFLKRYMRNHLMSGEDNIIILENSAASPNDPWLSKASSKIVTLNSDVYVVLPSNETSESTLIRAMDDAFNARLNIIIFTACSDVAGIRSLASLSERPGILAELVERVVAVAVDGYDFDSMVFLERMRK